MNIKNIKIGNELYWVTNGPEAYKVVVEKIYKTKKVKVKIVRGRNGDCEHWNVALPKDLYSNPSTARKVLDKLYRDYRDKEMTSLKRHLRAYRKWINREKKALT